jgi:integrase
MAGSLRQRGTDSWQLRVHAGRDPKTNRKRYVAQTVHGTKRQAERALAQLVAETESFTPRAAADSTLRLLLAEWLDHAAPDFSPKTVSTTRGYIDTAINPLIGGIPVAKLTAADLDRFYRHLLQIGGPKGPYAPATIRRVHGIVRRALSQGVKWGWLRFNPAINASPPRVPLKALSPPSPEQVAILFRLALETNPALAAFVLLAASSGARRGEIIALRRRDLNVAEGVLSIDRGIVLADGKLVEQGTKTHQGRRISLDANTRAILKNHFAQMEERARFVGAQLTPDSFMFSDAADSSSPWLPDSTTRSFRALCSKAGIRNIRLHDLRHYVATRLLSAGVDVRTVAGRLGHRNASTTLNVYAHFVPQADERAADLLGEIFDNAMALDRHDDSNPKPPLKSAG